MAATGSAQPPTIVLQDLPLPCATTLLQAAKLAQKEDKPIMMDYFADSALGKAFMGEDQETKEKMLIKSADEFTSLVQKIFKVAENFLVMTENSIYVVSGKVQKRRIQASSLMGATEM